MSESTLTSAKACLKYSAMGAATIQEKVEILLVGSGIVAGASGYLLTIGALAFLGLLGGCTGFGLLIARALRD
jgi:hypothetical protein